MHRHYLGVLIGAQDAFYEGIPAVYDLGPGQRPQAAIRALRQVARKESISVETALAGHGQSVLFVFLDEKPEKVLETARSHTCNER